MGVLGQFFSNIVKKIANTFKHTSGFGQVKNLLPGFVFVHDVLMTASTEQLQVGAQKLSILWTIKSMYQLR